MENTARALTPSNASILRSYLMTTPASEWSTQREITAWTGLSGVETRKVAHENPAMLVSGTQGYKLAAYATPDEIVHCVQTLLSRAEKITARAAALSGRLA